uniref:AlNc14C47G3758 protein n=1 Tax=Albugo laibachii Nc14 TaxID=890382 RepID=F0WAP4_9STRA|nr:AlNc14C47G3758 [Albugo laibachii Nc14]|eukprot:CCA18215.1 AlNc14C47G3758 [Albugo laibachii Nc14]
MGSYITIINDTDAAYFCKMKLHRTAAWTALAAGGIVLGGLAALAIPSSIGLRVAGTLGVGIASPVMFHSASAYFKPESQILRVQTGALYMNQFTNDTVSAIQHDLMANKYERIDRNSSHRYGMMTLNLVREADCINIYLESPSTMKMGAFTMRPLWSSGRIKGEHNYSIDSFLMKRPGKLYTIMTGNSINPSTVATDESIVGGAVASPGSLIGQPGTVKDQPPVLLKKPLYAGAGNPPVSPAYPPASTTSRGIQPTLHGVGTGANQNANMAPQINTPSVPAVQPLLKASALPNASASTNAPPLHTTPTSPPPTGTATVAVTTPPNTATPASISPVDANTPVIATPPPSANPFFNAPTTNI